MLKQYYLGLAFLLVFHSSPFPGMEFLALWIFCCVFAQMKISFDARKKIELLIERCVIKSVKPEKGDVQVGCQLYVYKRG